MGAAMDRPLPAAGTPDLDAALAAAGCTAREYEAGIAAVIDTCRQAWLAGVMTGFNGNMSLRVGGRGMLVTASGVDKGHMGPGDIALADAATGACLRGGRVSSEAAMHVAVYGSRPDARCVLHTHPEALLALSLRLSPERMLDMPLFEAGAWAPKMGVAAAADPGTRALADSVGAAAKDHPAVFMPGHGLCVHARNAVETLGITEQLEHLARVRLLTLGPV